MEKRGLKIITVFFFALFLLLGLFIYDDYGVYWDEIIEIKRGEAALEFAGGLGNTLSEKYYGASWEMTMAATRRVLGLNDPRQIIMIRHLANFLLFYTALIFFYLLARKKFGGYLWPLAAVILLVLSPRIFADAFYNSKDLVFLSVFIINIWSLFFYFRQRKFSGALLHGAITAFLVDIRLLGLLSVAMTVLSFGQNFRKRKELPKDEWNEQKNSLLVYFFTLTTLTILFWPLLWDQPLNNLVRAFLLMNKYPWSAETLYLGQYLKMDQIPWHYPLVWLLVSTPLLYTLFFLAGLSDLIRKIIKKTADAFDFVVGGWFFLPLGYVIISGAVVYDGWRHLFFIYPAFIIIAMVGLRRGALIVRNIKKTSLKKMAAALIIIALGTQIFSVISFMIQSHPYQNLYFNEVARFLFHPLRNNFDLDYWGISYRKGLEYILDRDKRPEIKIACATIAGVVNLAAIPAKERTRIKIVHEEKKNEADYYLTHYRFPPNRGNPPECQLEIFTLNVFNEKIMSVCQIR